MADKNTNKLAFNLGRTKGYLEDGLSVEEIAEKLNEEVYNVMAYVHIIKIAENNTNGMD